MHPGVAETAVIGTPDELAGHNFAVLKLCVSLSLSQHSCYTTHTTHTKFKCDEAALDKRACLASQDTLAQEIVCILFLI